MAALDQTLAHVSDLVWTDLGEYLSGNFVIAGVTSELLPGFRRRRLHQDHRDP